MDVKTREALLPIYKKLEALEQEVARVADPVWEVVLFFEGGGTYEEAIKKWDIDDITLAKGYLCVSEAREDLEILTDPLFESRRRPGRMLRESDSEWFNEHGWLLKEIPEECVRDIAQPGSADSAAEMWVDELDFKVPREKAIEYLYEYGDWDKEELEAKSDKDLAMTCLWLGAWDIAENGEWLGLVN